MLAKMGEEVALCAESRRLGEGVEPEIATLELALAKISPLGKGDRLAIASEHFHRVTMDDVLRQHDNALWILHFAENDAMSLLRYTIDFIDLSG